MSQPVKVADTLLEAARQAAAESHRSMAAQIEHWALLGRAVEQVLVTGDVLALKRSEGHLDAEQRQGLIETLAQALDPQRQDIARAAIGIRDAVRYETDPALPGLLIQIQPDGTRTAGRLVNRQFVPAVAHPTENPALAP
jgi:hypothetical protein